MTQKIVMFKVAGSKARERREMMVAFPPMILRKLILRLRRGNIRFLPSLLVLR